MKTERYTRTHDIENNIVVTRLLIGSKDATGPKRPDPKLEQSIHPRVVNGRTVHQKVNTARAPRKST